MTRSGEPRRMQIGEVAERTGLSVNTIRHYDQAHLVVPSARSEGGFRLYTDSDVERLLLIRRMKPLGFSLEQMAELLTVTDRLESHAELSVEARETLQIDAARFRELARSRREQLERETQWAQEFIDRIDRLLREDHA